MPTRPAGRVVARLRAESCDHRAVSVSGPTEPPADLLEQIGRDSADDAGSAPVELLGDFLIAVTRAVQSEQALSRRQMRRYQKLGATAAREGIALRPLLDLYLSAAWRLWRHLPAVLAAGDDPHRVVVAGEVMLHAVDDAVAALAEGYQLARRELVQAQVSARREFIDDLLLGAADVTSLVLRAPGFGLDLSGRQAVAVVVSELGFDDSQPVVAELQRAIRDERGDFGPLVATKDGLLIVVFPAPDRQAGQTITARLAEVLGPRPGDLSGVDLSRRTRLGRWQMTVGRSGVGVDGVVTSYREARSGHDIARRLQLDTPVVDSQDLLIYQVLLRDRPAIVDLVQSLLTPLLDARGGAEPLLQTLAAYFGAGGNATVTARRLHLSVRAVTYRLDRVAELTGQNPTDPAAQFGLQAAVLAARLLDWPTTPLTS